MQGKARNLFDADDAERSPAPLPEPRAAALIAKAALGPSIDGTIAGGFDVSLSTFNGSNIDPNKETWIVIHGWQEAPSDVQELAVQAQAQRPGAQIMVLDWAPAAAAADPADAEERTPLVGAWAAGALTSAGFASGAINLIGYSYGNYVAAETARNFSGGADVIIAVDPGADAPGSTYVAATEVNFAALSQFSVSFFANDIIYSNAAVAQTADEAIAIVDSAAGDSHGEAYWVAVNLFASVDGDGAGADAFFRFDRMLAHQPVGWLLNQYLGSGALGAGPFEAALHTTNNGNAPNGLDSVLFTGGADTGTLGRATLGVHALGGNDIVTGSSGNDEIFGDAGNDSLDGGAGADIMRGGFGDDIFYVDNAGDVATDEVNGGKDTVSASRSWAVASNIEQVVLTGTGDFNVAGNGLANVLRGNAGDNWLNGSFGKDTLTGGKGRDSFIFNRELGSNNIDTITDFDVPRDTIRIDNAVFAGIGPAGALALGAFNIGTAATQADDRIIYDSVSGKLYFDIDGVGAAAQQQFAQLTPGLAMTSADFIII